jgi:transcriptional regulator with XRE-family HTH domain
MTQEDLAAATLTLRVLSELEHGHANPTLRTLFMLAKKLNVRVAEFIDVEQVEPGREPLATRELRPPKRGRKPKARRPVR